MNPTKRNELVVELPADLKPEDAQLTLALRLFEKGQISLGWAARMAGFGKREFIDILGREGIPVFNYSAEELAEELDAASRRRLPENQ